MDLSIITENWELYLEGLITTIELVSLSVVIGFFLALPLGLMRASGVPWLSWPVWCFTYFFRGTPLLVQTFLFYYGLGQLEFVIQLSKEWTFLRDAYWYALFAFTLNTAAYTAEIIRGGVENTPFGEIEAARAAGMSRALMLRRIILPSAFRRILPAYSNEVIFMLHGSVVASVITVIDLLGAARILNARYLAPYETLLTAAALYMVLTYTLIWAFKRLEDRWYAHLRPRGT